MPSLTDKLQLWIDDLPRDGPQNMAVDEWLLETATVPILRVYRWLPGWGSFGYFVSGEEAKELIPGRRWVRRWTGGGIVDHETDWTYTLIAPERKWLAGLKGGESYRVIHAALAEALRSGGSEAMLAGANSPARGGECFVKAVEYDLCDPSGRKIAGAGQRRSRHGLLHQGSLALSVGADLARRFGECLADCVDVVELQPKSEEISTRVERRYGSSAWFERR